MTCLSLSRPLTLFAGPYRSPNQVWNALRGPERGVSNLVFAASMSESLEEHATGSEIFRLVYRALEKVGDGAVFVCVSTVRSRL